MNLQVNLILDTERRSGSNISRKFIIQIAASLAPVLLLMVILGMIFSCRSSARELANRKLQWASTEQTLKDVEKLEADKKAIQAVAADIEGWKQTRFEGHALLWSLPAVIPETVQLTQLTLTENFETQEKKLMRLGELYLQGKVGGETPEDDVKRLSAALKDAPRLKAYIEEVNVASYRDLEDQDKTKNAGMKKFEIKCKFLPRTVK